jgi:hypothetical protein
MKKGNIIIIIGCALMEILTMFYFILNIIEVQGGLYQLETALYFFIGFLIIITAEIALVLYGNFKVQYKAIEVYATIIPFSIPILSIIFVDNLADSLLYAYTEYYDQFVAYPHLILLLTAIIFLGSLKNILDRYHSEFE